MALEDTRVQHALRGSRDDGEALLKEQEAAGACACTHRRRSATAVASAMTKVGETLNRLDPACRYRAAPFPAERRLRELLRSAAARPALLAHIDSRGGRWAQVLLWRQVRLSDDLA